MKTIQSIVLVTMLLFPFYMQAQAPGYLGKRAAVSLNLSSFPEIFDGAHKNNKIYSIAGLNTELGLEFSYVVKRLRSVNLHLNRYTAGVFSYGSLISENSTIDYASLFHNITARSVGISYHYFRPNKGSIAPFGNQFYIGFKGAFVKGELYDLASKMPLSAQTDIDYDNANKQGIIFFGWSNNRIFWDKMLIKFGFQMGTPTSIFRFLRDETLTNSSTRDYRDEVYTRLFLSLIHI